MKLSELIFKIPKVIISKIVLIKRTCLCIILDKMHTWGNQANKHEKSGRIE